jgi:hypothetical protein
MTKRDILDLMLTIGESLASLLLFLCAFSVLASFFFLSFLGLVGIIKGLL